MALTYQEKKTSYLTYLQLKISEEDWHGVADCAMDLRELDVEYERPIKKFLIAKGITVKNEIINGEKYIVLETP